MKGMNSQDLLQAYAREGSEAAFQELVERYVNLVFSTAVRRVNGNRQLAEDITQQVFTDLARKARSLPRDLMLGGWLHRHTGFVAGTAMRGEQRRRNRERKAQEMNALNEPSDSDWQNLAPVLDEAMDELDGRDRDALVLRFFERLELRAVGAALGVSDDAAQKRVSRALEKLRELLLKRREAILPVAGLTAALGSRSVEAAPVGLGAKIGKAAFAAAAGGAGLIGGITNSLSAGAVKVALGAFAALVLAIALLVRPTHGNRTTQQPITRQNGEQPSAVGSTPSAELIRAAVPQVAGRMSEAARSNGLHLIILAADSGKPVPNVLVDYSGKTNEETKTLKFFGDRAGNCYITIPREAISEMQLTTRVDGFADTRLRWKPEHGETIPATYTLKLIRPVALGGSVVDADDQPVAGADIHFSQDDDPAAHKQLESHEFGWIKISTDTNGHWSLSRIAPEMLRRIWVSASHPSHLGVGGIRFSDWKGAEEEMRAGKFTFHLGRTTRVRGIVVDVDGTPVRDAEIVVGQRQGGGAGWKSGPDGTFEIRGCGLGKNLLTADAAGFAVTTIEVEVSTNSAPFTLTLQRGKVLRMRVAGEEGEPVANASVWLDTADYGVAPVQASLNGRTDNNGRIVWSNAPDSELNFSIYATGYMRRDMVKIRPGDEERVTTVTPELVVSGTVRDADTGELIPKFKVIHGSPHTNWVPDPANSGRVIAEVEGRFQPLERNGSTYSRGNFKHILNDAVFLSGSNSGYVLRFEAEDYAPFVSRPIAVSERHVEFDVKLRRAPSRQIAVLQPDGSPAIGTDVALIGPGADLWLTSHGFASWPANGANLMGTDNEGHFRLVGDPAITRVIAVNVRGYAETTPTALAEYPVLMLQPWGRLEGTFLAEGKPAEVRYLVLQITEDALVGRVRFEMNSSDFAPRPDADGHFVFPKVPPGKFRIAEEREVSPKDYRTIPLPDADVEIHAGQTTTKTVSALEDTPQNVSGR
jgi:RNA polymerase sigma factor (sigma-70 family)